MRAVAFIFARGGSKGLPRKNVLPLAGVPLIAHAIRVAQACPTLGCIHVSTDDDEIAAVAEEYGAIVPFLRPANLASDTASEWLAWRHAVAWAQDEYGEFDALVSLPCTSPFRAVEDVEACIDILRQEPETQAVATVKAAERSPYFNMVKLDRENVASLVCDGPQAIARRQDAPAVFDMTTVAYAVRPEFVMTHSSLFEGRLRAVEIPQERALDIDTPFDFAIAQCIATQFTITHD